MNLDEIYLVCIETGEWPVEMNDEEKKNFARTLMNEFNAAKTNFTLAAKKLDKIQKLIQFTEQTYGSIITLAKEEEN